MRHSRSALLVVDVQPDFLPAGALAVEGSDVILEPLRDLLLARRFPVHIATQDWHPPGHVSFASSHEGRSPFETIELYGHEQTLWPDHCVQGTAGARLHPLLPWDGLDAIVRKGTDPGCDSYSALRNNWNQEGQRVPTGVGGLLRERGVDEVFVCGLARDVCIRWTVEDAIAEGFAVTLLWDLTRSVDPSGDGSLRRSLERRGVKVIGGGEPEGG
jgi:nicotinamidase/pyrazinamidase